MNASRSLVLALLASLAACGGSSPPAKTTQVRPVVQPAADGDAKATCVSFFQRQRECTDEFIPALVALRVRLDKPAGIAETDRTGGRDALVAQAMEEWKSDSTDESIGRTCEHVIATATPEQMEQGKACLAKESCTPFVECVLPIMEQHISSK